MARHALWTVGAGAVVPVVLLYALITWTSPSGSPPLADVVGRGELFLVAAGLYVGTLRDVLDADRRLLVETIGLAAVVAIAFSVTAWASLVEVAVSGARRSEGQEVLATVWGSVTVVVAGVLGTIAAAVSAAKEDR
jgi:hypothetical protein